MSVLLTNPAAPPPPALCPSPPGVHTYCRPTASMMMSKAEVYFELCRVDSHLFALQAGVRVRRQGGAATPLQGAQASTQMGTQL